MSDPKPQAHEKGHYREHDSPQDKRGDLETGTAPAVLLEEVLQKILHDSTLTPEDRAALEKAVFIARKLQRKPQGGGR